ncbi:hypothetical protein ABZ780_06070 [Micromonospora sp. NPDC047467]|uniref:type II secretion system F family protein n=1 Tax=Micromonospora sp. NPDC047467 TaxID=3154814 RepID=UPI0033FA74BF
MSAATMLVAVLLLAAAALVAWPVRSIRARRRRVLASRSGADDALVEWVRSLGRVLDGSVDGAGAALTSARPAAVSYPTGAPDSSGGRTAVNWSTRDRDDSTSQPRASGGPLGSTRPAGPGRPPTRRDPRRPAAAARLEDETLDTGRRAGTSVAAPTIDGIDLELDWPGDSWGVPAVDSGPHDGPDVDRSDPARTDPADPAAGRPTARLAIRVAQPPTRLLLLVGLVGAGAGAVAAGPVAAVAVAGYGTLAVRALLRWRANRLAERVRRRGLDLLCGLAADLRAGLPVPPALEIAAVSGPGGSDRLRQLTSAAVRLADRTGAPLAELVERIEADARATDRGLAAAAAQAAGARATAWLLAALPVGGIGLGYGIGVDPLAVLLHSTVGGVCAVLAVALQVIGLFWAERLGATPGRAA